jgi:DNA-binding NarL/FixJ family response regulator
MTKPCNCIIVDDHQLFVDGLSRILSDLSDLKIVGVYNDSIDLPLHLEEKSADLLLLDIQLNSGISGLELCKEIRKVNTQVKVILISMIQAPHILKEAEKNGANGFIPKTIDAGILKDLIIKICKGENIFYSEGTSNEVINMLTDREMEIIHMIKQGHKTKTIAEKLFLSDYTVETHRKNILRKLQLRSASELIAYAYANHL